MSALMSRPPYELILIALTLGVACSPKYADSAKDDVGGAEGGDGGDGGGDGGADGGISGPDDNFPVEAIIRGTITVELFGTDEEGERYPIDWASSGCSTTPRWAPPSTR